ncbi:MAG TPA: hypothetical protein VN519_05985 [Bryobacteraceae bacterium]|nr:hypothetical protein [Bryobacteraceae bacterium]
MPGYQYLVWALLAAAQMAPCEDADIGGIVHRSMALLREAWDAVPGYAFVQRDESRSGGRLVSRTHLVVMIDGSDYYMPIANNDEPLPETERVRELRKLLAEKARREAENAKAHEKRTSGYLQQRRQNGMFITELPAAFHFTFAREATLADGHGVWVLAAAPNARKGALSREAKILARMNGFLWVEKETCRIVRAEASVTAPVSIFGIFARVLPGTQFAFETEPADLPMLSRLSLTLSISRLGFHSTQQTTSTYRDYRLNEEVMRELLAENARAEQ